MNYQLAPQPAASCAIVESFLVEPAKRGRMSDRVDMWMCVLVTCILTDLHTCSDIQSVYTCMSMCVDVGVLVCFICLYVYMFLYV